MLEHLAAVALVAWHHDVRRRDAARQSTHARGVPGRRVPGRARVHRRRRARHVPDRPDRDIAGDAGRAGADLGGPLGPPVPRAAVDRGGRRRPPARGRSATRCSPTSSPATSPGPSIPSTRTPTSSRACAAYPTILDVPDPVDLAVVTVPAASVMAVVEQCADKGVHGLIVISAGFAERGSADDRARAGRARPPARDAPGRPERHGRRQHRSRRLDERDLRAVPAGARAHRVRVAVGRARHRAARPGRAPRARHVDVRVDGQQGRRQQQRPAAVLGPRSRDVGDPPLPRVVREPAEVRPAGASDRPLEAHPGGEERTDACGNARCGIAHRRPRVVGRRHRRALPPGRASSGWTRWPSCSTPPRCSSTNRSPRAGGSRSCRTAAVPGSWRPTRARAPGLEVPELSAATQETLRGFVSPDASTANPVDLIAVRDCGDLRARDPRRARRSRHRRGDRDLRAAARHRVRRRRRAPSSPPRPPRDRSRSSRAS